MEDPKLQQLLDVYEAINRNAAAPEEVGEALYVLVQNIIRIRDELKIEISSGVASASGQAEKGIVALLSKVRGLIDVASRKAEKDDLALKKLIDGLLAWKAEEEDRTTDDDIALALELADENTVAIKKLRSALKDIKDRPAVRGPRGRVPQHEWDDTRLRFQNQDNTWGDWVDLKGESGQTIGGFFGFGGGPVMGVRRIKAGAGIIITGDPGEPTITATGTGSGLQSVVAGSGISVDNTDPLNPIVAATGAAAFAVLLPSSGNVDGVNKVFVFATAPKVVVLDGGNVMNKVASDGTVNWTGTTTITLAQAPNNNIFAF